MSFNRSMTATILLTSVLMRNNTANSELLQKQPYHRNT